MTGAVGRLAQRSETDAAPPSKPARRGRQGWWRRRLRLGLPRAVALALLAVLLALRAWDPLPVEALRLRTFDLYQNLAPRPIAARPAVIVDIDEESMAAISQWPWPRTVLADMVDRLFRLGAVAVAFDSVFPEPDRMSPANVAQAFRGLNDEARASLNAMPSNDSVFADSLRRGRVVLGQATMERPVAGAAPRPAAVTPVAEIGGDPRPHLFHYPAVLRNVPEIEAAAAGRGMMTIPPESDNIVRRVPAVMRVGEALYPSLVVELLRVATGQSTYGVRVDRAGVQGIVVAGTLIPTDGQGRIWVHFSAPDPARYLSAHKVIDGSAPPESVRGKLVLVGASAAGLRDLRATPLSPTMPGVEVHAQLIETILSGSHLVRPNYAPGAELTLTLVAGLLIVTLVPLVGAWWTLAIGTVVAASLAGTSWYLYLEQRMLIDVGYAMGSAIVLYGVLTFLGFAREEAQRQRIKTAFSRYLSPDVVSRLAEDSSQLKLGGEMREMTLLFTDVEGFTRISENYDAVGLTNLVNSILTPLTRCVLATGGTVDKYMGDAIMAFWNAPLNDAEHARHACLTGLAIRREIAPLNERIRADAEARGRPFSPINVGVGINTGECCVGNMGSDLRFDYSVLGDTVNIASRLEGQTRTYRVGIVVGETTQAQAPDLAFLEVDLLRVVGKTRPVRIFTLAGDAAHAATPAFQALAAKHAALIAAYRAQDWDAAEALCGECLALEPAFAGLYQVYAERIAGFRLDPPPPAWDGVYVATSKH
ncbi:MAG: CHASE2 domain-containing protein [Rhodospirillales bacterium]